MEYKLEERTLDLQELLESCQTRVSFLPLKAVFDNTWGPLWVMFVTAN